MGEVPERWRLGPDFVPKGRYIDREFLALELEQLFPRAWQMACREEEIPSVGSYVEYGIGDQSILVVRSAPERFQAFYNACVHRGTRLARGQGRCREFRCPFHGWRYALDGELIFQFCEDEFLARDADYRRLRELRADSWGGWVFVNMDPDAEPLLDWLDPLPTLLGPFELERMRYRWHKRTILPANWKTALDAFIEGYHTAGTHPQYLRFAEGSRPSTRPAEISEYAHSSYTPTSTYRNHSRFLFGVRDDAQGAMMGAPDATLVASQVRYQVEQLRSLNTVHDAEAARELCKMDLRAGESPYAVFARLRRQHHQAAGVRWPDMTPEQFAAGTGDWHVFPTMIGLFELGCALGYRALPNGSDPDSCIFDIWSLEFFPDDRGPHVELEFYENWEDGDVGQVLSQDFRNMADVTAGLHQRGFEGHWLNQKQETSVHNAHRIADRFLFGVDA